MRKLYWDSWRGERIEKERGSMGSSVSSFQDGMLMTVVEEKDTMRFYAM